MVTSKCVKFDDDLVLPSGTTFAFATMCIQRDPEVFADPDKFDGLRFYKLQQENDKGKVIENSREASSCPATFGTL
jgi:cytochrome P450